jgi:nascent polypeptide-associated complex subunit alpha
MGLKPEPGVLRVQIKKTNAMAFSISKPEVYRFPGTNTFVIFGEAQVEDAPADAAKAAARSVTQTESAPAAPAAQNDADDNEDAGGIPDKEIEIVMSQASVSRGKAIRALKNNKGDIVNAIMELTM